MPTEEKLPVPLPPASAPVPATQTHRLPAQSPPRPRSLSTSVPPTEASATAHTTTAASQHKRVYQACIPCRRRKVRCDLGSVDNPHDPPCVRCRRESKECFFSATRRKRKTDDVDPEVDLESDEYIIRNGRKRLHAEPVVRVDRFGGEIPLTPGGSLGRREPLRRPGGRERGREFSGEDSNAQLANLEAQAVMKDRVYGQHDALDLLYKAATDSPTIETRPKTSRASTVGSNMPTPTGLPMGPGLGHSRAHSRVDGDLPGPQGRMPGHPVEVEPANALEDALKSWGRFRFVRAGWFTAQEAVAYIDYYYTYLSPLTPISPPTFRNPATHTTLLSEEPILTVTLLTITSRYMKLSGPGGECRANAIHEQLWTYLRGMIERCLWGQEAFGGRLHPSGPTTEDFQTSSTAPWRGLRKGSLRTLGTIESLMILTEWHPRALHFPPAEAIDELMLPSYEATMLNDAEQRQSWDSTSYGGKRIESWLEPAWRSDRMCWMLLSTAMGLAYELGVFDDIDELLRDGAVPRPEYEEEGYRQRAYRIKRLLLIYLTQLAGRLGWKNMVPEQLWKSDPAVSRKRRDTTEGMTPASHSSLATAFNYIPDLELDDQIIHCWAGVSNTMHIGNERLFRSRKHTTEIIQSGRYADLLKEFQPMLRNWWSEFERFRLPPYIRYILTIEYEYVRIYINSLSLQAVVERCTSQANIALAGNDNVSADGSVSGNQGGSQISSQTQNHYGKLPLGQLGGLTEADQVYIREVIDGCRNLLKTVVQGLLPKGYLKHAPVRTYFRIISGAMFLLKTFALGAPRSDVRISIGLMDQAVEALRNCVVDDVHLGVRFADLLETLTSRLRTRFIQAPVVKETEDPTGPQQPPNEAAKEGHQPTTTSTDPINGQSAATIAPVDNKLYPFPTAPLAPGPTPAAAPSQIPFMAQPPSLPSAPVINGATTAGGSLADDWASGMDMWYLPTGLFQNMENSDVQMTAEGIQIGGADMLDYMMDFRDIDGGSAGFP